MTYDIPLMILSVLVAISGSALALYIISQPVVSKKSVLAGGFAMATAICGMHYIGMFSMRMPARTEWDLALVAFSFLIALVASYLALIIALHVRNKPPFSLEQILSSFLMGGAIAGMHYTGMAAASFFPVEKFTQKTSDIIATDMLTVVLIMTTVFILGLALASSAVERALSARTKRALENMKLYNDAKKVAAELKEERNLRERFVSALAHDLRTPLAGAIMANKSILENPQDAKAAQLFSNLAIESLERMQGMIEDLLDAHRLKAGQPLSLQVEKCQVQEFLLKVLGDLKPLYGDRFILKSNSPITAHWDLKYMRRAIENLCTNGIKYGRQGTPVTVTVIMNADLGSRIQLLIHNEGEPLSSEERETLFGIFRRGHNAQTSGKHGWGLGLTITRGVAEAHNGTLKVESSHEQGTTFILEVPLDAQDLSYAASLSPGLRNLE